MHVVAHPADNERLHTAGRALRGAVGRACQAPSPSPVPQLAQAIPFGGSYITVAPMGHPRGGLLLQEGSSSEQPRRKAPSTPACCQAAAVRGRGAWGSPGHPQAVWRHPHVPAALLLGELHSPLQDILVLGCPRSSPPLCLLEPAAWPRGAQGSGSSSAAQGPELLGQHRGAWSSPGWGQPQRALSLTASNERLCSEAGFLSVLFCSLLVSRGYSSPLVRALTGHWQTSIRHAAACGSLNSPTKNSFPGNKTRNRPKEDESPASFHHQNYRSAVYSVPSPSKHRVTC